MTDAVAASSLVSVELDCVCGVLITDAVAASSLVSVELDWVCGLIAAAVAASSLVSVELPDFGDPINAATPASSLARVPSPACGRVAIADATPASFLAETPLPGWAGGSATITLVSPCVTELAVVVDQGVGPGRAGRSEGQGQHRHQQLAGVRKGDLSLCVLHDYLLGSAV